MGRPRKYKRAEMRKKCQTCGKFTNFPYIHTTVPTYSELTEIPVYHRGGERTKRTELAGERKVKVSYHCDHDCYSDYTERV